MTRETIVLLHGFAGTGRSWDAVIERLPESYTALAPDLRGHGDARASAPVSFEAVVSDVLAAAPARFALVGYSMGGRVALHVALAAPERVTRLVLVSTSAGIEDPHERETRRIADEELAARLDRAGDLDDFADDWLTQPLFADDPPAAQQRAREEIARNSPSALAAALRGLSVGVMRPLWAELSQLKMPALVLSGERDARYCTFAERLAATMPQARAQQIADAGHALPREAPVELAGRIAEG